MAEVRKMLNREQREHLAYVESLPLTGRCWCGWYRLGDCWGERGCNQQHPGQTRADALRGDEVSNG